MTAEGFTGLPGIFSKHHTCIMLKMSPAREGAGRWKGVANNVWGGRGSGGAGTSSEQKMPSTMTCQRLKVFSLPLLPAAKKAESATVLCMTAYIYMQYRAAPLKGALRAQQYYV